MIKPDRIRILVFYKNVENLRSKLSGLEYHDTISGHPFLYDSMRTNVEYIFLHAPTDMHDVNALVTIIESMIQPSLVLVNDEELSTKAMRAIVAITARLGIKENPQVLRDFIGNNAVDNI